MTKDFSFPRNNVGLERGSFIRANQDFFFLGIEKGMEFPIGFDGQYVRCSGLIWDVEGLIEEIQDGAWIVTDKKVNLNDPEMAKKFIKAVEKREV